MSVKRAIKSVLPLLPANIRRLMLDMAGRRRMAEVRKRKERTRISLEQIDTVLARFSFENDMLIHSSISNMGKLEGTVPQLTKLLLARFDLDAHTLLAPALPFNSSMMEYLESCSGFDVGTAKNAMGAIPNILMQEEACIRSVHPTHSTIALGKRRIEYVEKHENDITPFGENSPFYRLVRNNGKILMLGVGLNSVTNFHVYEDMLGAHMPVQVYTDKTYAIPCIDRNGLEMTVRTRCHSPFLSAKRECERARSYLIEAGYIETYPVGESEISLLDAKGHTLTLLNMLRDGDSIYGKVSLNGDQKNKIEECLRMLS